MLATKHKRRRSTVATKARARRSSGPTDLSTISLAPSKAETDFKLAIQNPFYSIQYSHSTLQQVSQLDVHVTDAGLRAVANMIIENIKPIMFFVVVGYLVYASNDSE
jgi:hypothetical protein